jgi:2-keto-4-pentenoate hydratase
MEIIDHANAAVLLSMAYTTGVPVVPLSETYPTIDVDDAYDIQRRQITLWETAGRTIVGHKVGLTSAAMQAQLGVDQPDFGVLLADTRHEDGSTIDAAIFISPRVEPEIAFILKSDLVGPGVTVQQAVAAVDHVSAALEIIDSRIADWRITLVDTIADNASFGAFVLGASVALSDNLDLAGVECSMLRNGDEVQSGRGDAVLGSSINALVWLANTLGDRGVRLTAGDIVMPGSITAAVAVASGDTIQADFTGIGSVSITFQ